MHSYLFQIILEKCSLKPSENFQMSALLQFITLQTRSKGVQMDGPLNNVKNPFLFSSTFSVVLASSCLKRKISHPSCKPGRQVPNDKLTVLKSIIHFTQDKFKSFLFESVNPFAFFSRIATLLMYLVTPLFLHKVNDPTGFCMAYLRTY